MPEVITLIPDVKVDRHDNDLVIFETLPSVDAKRDWLRQNMIAAWKEWEDTSRKVGPEGMHQPGDFLTWSNDMTSFGCLMKSIVDYSSGRQSGTLFPQTPDGQALRSEISSVWRIFSGRAKIESDPNSAIDIIAIKDSVAGIGGQDIANLMSMRAGAQDGADAFAHIETIPIRIAAPLDMADLQTGTWAGGGNDEEFVMRAARDFYIISGRVPERSHRVGVAPADKSEFYKFWMSIMAKVLNPDLLLMDFAAGRSNWTQDNAYVMSSGIGSYVAEVALPPVIAGGPGGVGGDPAHRRPEDLRAHQFTAAELRAAPWAGKKPIPLYLLDVMKTAGIVAVTEAYNADNYAGWFSMHAKMAELITSGKLFGHLLPDNPLAVSELVHDVVEKSFEYTRKRGALKHSIHWEEVKAKLPHRPDSDINARSQDYGQAELARGLMTVAPLMAGTETADLADKFCGGYQQFVKKATGIPGEKSKVALSMLGGLARTAQKTFGDK